MQNKHCVLVVDPYTEIIGPHQVLANLIHKLSEVGWHFIVVVPAKGATYYHLQSLGAEVCIMSGVETIRRGLSISQLMKMACQSLGTVRALVGLIQERSVVLVHSATVGSCLGGLAARFAHVPSIYHVHDLTLNSNKLVGLMLGSIMVLTSDRLICVSKAAFYALPMYKFNAGKACVVYNAVDSEIYFPDPLSRLKIREELGITSSAPLIGVFGGVDYRKGQDLFIHAASIVIRSIPEAKFIIVGGASPAAIESGYNQSLKDLVARYSLEGTVLFLGARHEIPKLMQAVDIVVQPSRIDAGPLVPLEAMASGLPVIATNVGANPEEVEDSVTGIVIPPEDDKAMAEAIILLMKAPLLRSNLGKAARVRIHQQFDIRQQTYKVAFIYYALLHS